mmetsp:Transcript_29854/g.97216  ORF Transcript_29854/g.97216 Transcript_29854/m.97216 type:complete len:453 (+) Transcript_29854:507-1865(+)
MEFGLLRWRRRFIVFDGLRSRCGGCCFEVTSDARGFAVGSEGWELSGGFGGVAPPRPAFGPHPRLAALPLLRVRIGFALRLRLRLVRLFERVRKNGGFDDFDAVTGGSVLGVGGGALHRGEGVEAADDGGKDGVLVVEVGGALVEDVELLLVGILAGVGHGDDSARVVPQLWVELVLEGAAPERVAAGARAGGVAPLHHKVFNGAVEDCAIVAPGAAEAEEIFGGLRDEVGVHLEVEVARARLEADVAFGFDGALHVNLGEGGSRLDRGDGGGEGAGGGAGGVERLFHAARTHLEGGGHGRRSRDALVRGPRVRAGLEGVRRQRRPLRGAIEPRRIRSLSRFFPALFRRRLRFRLEQKALRLSALAAPASLHRRSCGFGVERARQRPLRVCADVAEAASRLRLRPRNLDPALHKVVLVDAEPSREVLRVLQYEQVLARERLVRHQIAQVFRL